MVAGESGNEVVLMNHQASGRAGERADTSRLNEQIEAEERPRAATGPAVHTPDGLHVLVRGTREYRLIRTAIELLGKRSQRFLRPGLAIMRAQNFDVNAFLLDSVSDAERKEQVIAAVIPEVKCQTLAGFSYRCFF